MLKCWWERWPDRLQHELRELERIGVRYELDERALQVEKKVNVRVWPTVEGQSLELVAVFPDLYPYIRVEVFAPTLRLAHHQNPFGGNLCLFGRATQNWSVTDTLAGIIETRLPLVLKAGRSEDRGEVSSIEEHQGEPLSTYFTYQQDEALLVDSSWSVDPAVAHGELSIGIRDAPGVLLQGVLAEVRDTRSRRLAAADPALLRLYPRRIRGRWVRVGESVLLDGPGTFPALIAKHPFLREPLWQMGEGRQVDIVGLVFAEETAWRCRADGWVFIVRTRKMKRGKPGPQTMYLVRGPRAGREDLVSRVPELSALRQKCVVTVGLGAIGAPSAIEFARTGIGELRILDGDIVEAGTIPRWPFGLAAVGSLKTTTLMRFFKTNYPYTAVRSWSHRIGALDGEPRDLVVLDELVTGADLIYDATAEVGIQHLLSDLAAERAIPYICVSSTFGAWGGLVGRIRPGMTTGCWFCIQAWLMDGKIPTPPADPAGLIQPAGCADPTFTGAGFDLSPIAAFGVRLAVSTLCHGADKGYPEIDDDVFVVSVRDRDGRNIAPQYDGYRLTPHPSCAICQKR